MAKRKNLHDINKILNSTFEKSIKLIDKNVELLGLNKRQSKEYFELFASIRRHRRCESYAGPDTGYEAAALMDLWKFHNTYELIQDIRKERG